MFPDWMFPSGTAGSRPPVEGRLEPCWPEDQEDQLLLFLTYVPSGWRTHPELVEPLPPPVDPWMVLAEASATPETPTPKDTSWLFPFPPPETTEEDSKLT